MIKATPFKPSEQDLRDYYVGFGYMSDSPMAHKVKEMPDHVLKVKQGEYLSALRKLDRKRREYEIAYHKWFLLREEGERRGFWMFTPRKSD